MSAAVPDESSGSTLLAALLVAERHEGRVRQPEKWRLRE
jgi:hypothetical protein